MFLPRQQHFLQRWLLQVHTEKRKNLYLDLVVSPKLLSMEKYSLLCSPPPLYFFGWFNKKIDVLYQGCQKRFHKDQTPKNSPICPHVFVSVFSTHWGQYLAILVRTSGVGNALFVPSLVTRDWDYPLTLPDIPSIMRHETCDAPHMQLPADQQPLMHSDEIVPTLS